MIGMELLNLMYGNPMAGASPSPNPAPMAPKPAPTPVVPKPQGRIESQPSVTAGPISPVGSPSPSGAPGQASAAPAPPPPAAPPQQPSAAPASPPDLMQLYQRLHSANEIDRGLSGLATLFAAPGAQNAVAAATRPPDNSGDLGNIMQLMMMQRQMQALPAVAQQLGISPETAMALGPQGVQKLVEQKAQSTIDIQKQGLEQKQKDRLDAAQAAPGAIQQFGAADSLASQIQNAKDADGKSVMENITGSALLRNAAQAMIDAQTKEPGKEQHGGMTENAAYYLANATGQLTNQEKDTINNLIQLNGMVYGEQFAKAGSRRTQAEIKGLQSGASQLFALNQSYGNYAKQFGDFQDKLHTSIANTYGEAGMLDQLPEQYRFNADGTPRPNSLFLPKGELYAGGGEWASNPPPREAAQGGTAAKFDYGSIKSGDTYTAPDGTLRRKQ